MTIYTCTIPLQQIVQRVIDNGQDYLELMNAIHGISSEDAINLLSGELMFDDENNLATVLTQFDRERGCLLDCITKLQNEFVRISFDGGKHYFVYKHVAESAELHLNGSNHNEAAWRRQITNNAIAVIHYSEL